ncbi:MAG TPA: elongation factor P [Limnochordales bacterium]
MISVNDLRTGLTIEVDGEVWIVLEFLHVKPGKGAAFVRTRLKNLKTGNVIERNFRAGERVQRAHVETREMQYLYHSGSEWVFMDTRSFEQVSIDEANLGDAPKYLKENDVILIQFYEGRPIGVELPTFVELKVVETEPGVRGDTAQGGSKPARLETGLVIQVPLFINPGDVVRVDTRTGEYLSRA